MFMIPEKQTKINQYCIFKNCLEILVKNVLITLKQGDREECFRKLFQTQVVMHSCLLSGCLDLHIMDPINTASWMMEEGKNKNQRPPSHSKISSPTVFKTLKV